MQLWTCIVLDCALLSITAAAIPDISLLCERERNWLQIIEMNWGKAPNEGQY
ncbi:conserved hypothetical protein [Ricinus communis]|uniref:Uncharacterized protein n=1 Tax=Ricinus communis TaxID=3988 RepID=B9REG6_RICCO|nr:conserved hypothetical protein [Ricinus communis]